MNSQGQQIDCITISQVNNTFSRPTLLSKSLLSTFPFLSHEKISHLSIRLL